MADAPTISKPIPEPDEDSRPFWEAGMQHKLMLMRCSDCGAHRLPSRAHCDRCLSTEFEWKEASGKGTVRTFGVMHQLYHQGFAQEIPYTVAVVELEEGPRIHTNIINAGNRPVTVDMPVTIAWEDHEDVSLPKFTPA